LPSGAISAGEALWNKLIPTLCTLICVAALGATMTHGMSDLRHEVTHATIE